VRHTKLICPVQALQTPAPPRHPRRARERTDVGTTYVLPTEPERARRRNTPSPPVDGRCSMYLCVHQPRDLFLFVMHYLRL